MNAVPRALACAACLVGMCAFPPQSLAAVAFAPVFTDRMVIQCGLPAPVWGGAEPGEPVTVEFAGQAKSTVADPLGAWRVTLDPLAASDSPRELTARGRTTARIGEVLTGEVWLCAGQSNMLIGLERLKISKFASEEERRQALALIDAELAAGTPGLRLLQVSAKKPAAWMECTADALRNRDRETQGFSAAAYFFGQRLRRELKVPIGLIQAAVGGSRIEAWTPASAYAALPAFRGELDGGAPLIDGMAPGAFFRSMVQPLSPLGMRGVIWYQGESNLLSGDDGPRYADKMRALIAGWRSAWSRPDLPFYYVQLPPMAYSRGRHASARTPEALPCFREGQAQALRLPGTGMVVTTDLAPVDDLHPADKWDVGRRLADLALARAYGVDVPCAGPRYQGMERRGAALVVGFDSAGGLASRDGGPLTGFAVAGADRVFHAADAVIEDGRIVVSSAQVPQPVAVRFAWHEDARPNLCDRTGLPAAPFRTDDWPVAVAR